MSDEQSREEKLAEIRARVEQLRKARAGGDAAPAAPAAPAEPAAPESAEPAAPSGETEAVPTPAAGDAEAGKPEDGAELSREDKLAQVRARAEALRAARAGGAAPAGPAAPAKAAPPKPAASVLEVPVSSLNPGGRPGTPPQHPSLEAYGTINQSVELRGDAAEHENIKKLLGGLGAYQNPLRSDSWQIDYRYYAEARRRLQAAGYTVTEKDYLERPLTAWNPVVRGWTRVEP